MKKRIILRFKKNTIDKPIVYRLAKDFNLVYNILRANVSPRAESMMVMEVEGEEADFAKGIEYLSGFQHRHRAHRSRISTGTRRSASTAVSARASARPRPSTSTEERCEVRFDYEKCVACELVCQGLPGKGDAGLFYVIFPKGS